MRIVVSTMAQTVMPANGVMIAGVVMPQAVLSSDRAVAVSIVAVGQVMVWDGASR